MANAMPALTEPQTDAQHEAAIEDMLEEMRGLNQRMKSDKIEIDRLKRESLLIQSEIEAIKERTQSRLTSSLPW